jgi:hypothetical protein
MTKKKSMEILLVERAVINIKGISLVAQNRELYMVDLSLSHINDLGRRLQGKGWRSLPAFE